MIISLAMMTLFVNPVRGQDERFWRKMLSGELTREAQKPKVETKWEFASPLYHYDLNGDSREEVIQVLKRDGMDWLDITGHDKAKLFSGKLWAMGIGSSLYRVRLIQLSPTARVLVRLWY